MSKANKIKKDILFIISIICILAVLVSCGNSEIDETEESNHIDVIENQTDNLTENTVFDDDSGKDLSLDEMNIDSEATEEEYNQENNGHFVQIGDKVYFHTTAKEGLGKPALWGNYADSEINNTVLYEFDSTTELVADSYDDSAKAISEDYSGGPLAFQNGKLYYYGCEDLPTDKTQFLGAGIGGEYIATHNYDYVDNQSINKISIYSDGDIKNEFDIDGYAGCIKLGEKDLFLLLNEEDRYSLRQINIESGQTIDLGQLPSLEYSYGSGTVDECLISGDRIYFAYSYYEGTGHFFSGGFYVQAQIGCENSLVYEDMPDNFEYGDDFFAPFAVIDGKMVAVDGQPGTCEVNDNGDLGYFDINGKWNYVASGWETKYYENEDYDGVELAEKIGDYIYLIYNGNLRAPEEDIGWRYAYYRLYSSVYRVSVITGESERIAHQVQPMFD